MISTPESKIFECPFTSYAGIRYLLPFMHRTNFMSNKNSTEERYGGSWDISKLNEILSLLENK